jgi:lipoyl(octanoyl) transferase
MQAPVRIICVQRGLEPYEQSLAAMRAYIASVDAQAPDQLWLTEHPAVFTLGQAGKPEHVLSPGSIPVIKTERGGQVTYHGPGQAVLYPLLHLRRYHLNVRCYVHCLEQSVIDLLAHYSIAAQRREGAPGVYVNDAKVAALGVKISRGVAFHGLALNVCMDLAAYQCINPCGYPGMQVTDMQTLLPHRTLDFATVQAELGQTLLQRLCAMPAPT